MAKAKPTQTLIVTCKFCGGNLITTDHDYAEALADWVHHHVRTCIPEDDRQEVIDGRLYFNLEII